ncbi:MAG: porphobilinogen synthase [Aestuariivita sp.]|nr:porphobilinogen synthase [Aestuariivita sp.]
MKLTVAPFPGTRFRRTRRTSAIRALVQENVLSKKDLIWPLFLREGTNIKEEIPSMPGVFRHSVDRISEVASEAEQLGIAAVCLFPYTEIELKTKNCSEAWNPENLSNRATREIKANVHNLAVMTDVALDPYNIDGHDGYFRDGIIQNDETIKALVKQALSQAEAGTDIIGPSDMMDGRIGAIRQALEKNNFKDVCIMSYAAKYASAFYGPFRDAVGASGSLQGDKKTYQMNSSNTNEALRLIERDLMEGADMIMVKPGMPYLDICQRAKEDFGVPTFAYQVSGEYAMIQAAAQNQWIDGPNAILESLLAFKRAGCNGILTYFAPMVAKLLDN